MKSKIMAKVTDKRQKNRRYRDILANSGLVMEDGEIRDIPNLYVRSYGGELINVNDLNKDPEKQTEEYSVKAQADHGEEIDGYSVPTVEKQFGSCRVWTEDDGLHARVYFANDDALADHLFAISDDASYSIGTEWAEPGYEWDGKVYEDTIGILREISMVITGNDPRARTIDHKAEAKGSEGAAETNGNNKKGNNTMGKTTKDALTPNERNAMLRKGVEDLTELINDFTTDVPESETEPTARDNAEVEGEKKEDKTDPKEQAATEKKDSNTLHMPINVIRVNDRIRNERAGEPKNDSRKWLATDAGKAKFRALFDTHGQKITPAFDAALQAEAKKDGITGLAAPAPMEQIFITTMEKRDGIYSHFRNLSVKSYRINVLTAGAGEQGRAHGFKKGDTKIDQSVTATDRELLTKMVYKRLTIDSGELYENPELYDIRREELVEALFVEMERAAVIGDGRTAPTGSNPDYRMFDGVRGFWSMVADAANTSSVFATAITGVAGENLYDARIDSYSALKAEGRRIMVAKGSVLGAVRKQKNADGSYLVAPGARLEDILDVDVIYEPSWMEEATVDAVIFVENAYTVIGETNQIREKTAFDVDTNGDVLLVETPRGGSLAKAKSAVTITLTPATPAETASSK